MHKHQQSVECRAKFTVGSPEDFVVQALRKIHKKNGNYNFLPMQTLLDILDKKTKLILNDPENGTLDRLTQMKIVTIQCENELLICLDPSHRMSLKTKKPPLA